MYLQLNVICLNLSISTTQVDEFSKLNTPALTHKMIHTSTRGVSITSMHHFIIFFSSFISPKYPQKKISLIQCVCKIAIIAYLWIWLMKFLPSLTLLLSSPTSVQTSLALGWIYILFYSNKDLFYLYWINTRFNSNWRCFWIKKYVLLCKKCLAWNKKIKFEQLHCAHNRLSCWSKFIIKVLKVARRQALVRQTGTA